MKGFVFIETRRLAGLHLKVNEFRKFTGWPGIVVCCKKNEDLFSDQEEKLMIGEIFNLYQYNLLMTNKEFWKSIPFDEVLICQHDSGLLKTGIDDFLGYDWVGAPWIFQNHGGNGGLSLRRKQSMLDICSNTHYSTNLGNEDLFYCNIMYYSKNFKLAPREVCERFSVEGIFKLGTLGYHFGVDSNRLLTTDQKKQILRQYEQKGRVRANI